jgi:hypothetical protein
MTLATEWTVNVFGEQGTQFIFRNESVAQDVETHLSNNGVDCSREGDRVISPRYWKDVFKVLIEIDSIH